MENINISKKLKEISRNMSVLYVEDDENLSLEMKVLLDNFFQNVILAQNGQDGLDKFIDYHKASGKFFDLVITDIKMPQMDGLLMSKEIKSINNEQKILVVSGENDTNLYLEFYQIPIDGYILKPIFHSQVIKALLNIAQVVYDRNMRQSYQDILETTLHEKVQELQKHYFIDQLTKLPNKESLKDNLQTSEEKTIIRLDIKNFGLFNMSFGVVIGDDILIDLSNKLKSFQTKQFTLYRFSGDEFVFLANGIHKDEAKQLAEKVNMYFKKFPLEYNEIKFYCRFSIVIDYGVANKLLKITTLAMHFLKKSERNNICIHENYESIEIEQTKNFKLIKRIKDAIENDQLVPYFQSIVDIKTNKISKYEVLARIVTQNNEIMLPNEFIKASYLGGYGTTVTKTMIEKSFKIIKDKDIEISINITQDDLVANYLLDFIEKERKKNNLKASQITLEILETISSERAQESQCQIQNLKSLGYKIAIDDFGAEMSNFSRLLNINCDSIKIDGSFIQNIDKNDNLRIIVDSIINFSHNIGATCVAEHVSSKEIYDILKDLNIDYVQGFYLSKPSAKLNLDL